MWCWLRLLQNPHIFMHTHINDNQSIKWKAYRIWIFSIFYSKLRNHQRIFKVLNVFVLLQVYSPKRNKITRKRCRCICYSWVTQLDDKTINEYETEKKPSLNCEEDRKKTHLHVLLLWAWMRFMIVDGSSDMNWCFVFIEIHLQYTQTNTQFVELFNI